MTIVTMTTDWGRANHYSGTVKGTLLRLIPDVRIVEITHEVPAFDIMQAYFILRHAYPNFPDNTIHLVGVKSEAGIQTPHVVVKHHGQFFIGADNGIFSLLFENKPDLVFEIELHQDSNYFTFSTRDVFAKAAAHIASGRPLAEIGKTRNSLNQKISFKPVIYPERIVGKVVFIDGYENVFVNIDEELFKSVGKGRRFIINFRSPGNSIEKIHESYDDVMEGQIVALFGTTGYLEIAINQGKASSLLGLQLTDAVSIDFESETS